MWIRTQDQKKLLDIISFSIERNYASNNKAAIIGVYVPPSFFHSNSIILGLYKTENDALQELNNVQNYIDSNMRSVYQMK